MHAHCPSLQGVEQRLVRASQKSLQAECFDFFSESRAPDGVQVRRHLVE